MKIDHSLPVDMPLTVVESEGRRIVTLMRLELIRSPVKQRVENYVARTLTFTATRCTVIIDVWLHARRYAKPVLVSLLCCIWVHFIPLPSRILFKLNGIQSRGKVISINEFCNFAYTYCFVRA
jgi:hypothetical protein